MEGFLGCWGWGGVMSVKDWKLYCSVICSDLDQPEEEEKRCPPLLLIKIMRKQI